MPDTDHLTQAHVLLRAGADYVFDHIQRADPPTGTGFRVIADLYANATAWTIVEEDAERYVGKAEVAPLLRIAMADESTYRILYPDGWLMTLEMMDSGARILTYPSHVSVRWSGIMVWRELAHAHMTLSLGLDALQTHAARLEEEVRCILFEMELIDHLSHGRYLTAVEALPKARTDRGDPMDFLQGQVPWILQFAFPGDAINMNDDEWRVKAEKIFMPMALRSLAGVTDDIQRYIEPLDYLHRLFGAS